MAPVDRDAQDERLHSVQSWAILATICRARVPLWFFSFRAQGETGGAAGT